MLSRIGSFRSSSKATGEGSAIPAMITDGLLAEWRFAEGSGAAVADSVNGSYPINLDLPTTPNYTWNSKGVSLAAGLVQTPTVTGVRTIAILYKVARNEASGFLISGGSGGSGAGWLANSIMPAASSEAAHIGFGGGVRPIRSTNDAGPATGVSAHVLTRGGWVLAFRQLNAAVTQPFGFGGRHSTTTSRCATFDIAWAGMWDDALTSDERTQVYNAVRARYGKPRGIYLDYQDAPTTADIVLLAGQSNARGNSLISELSAPDQAQVYDQVYIEPCSQGTRSTAPAALLVLGTNQTLITPASLFGPEIGTALRREADGGKNLYIVKTAEGSTYLAPSSVGAPVTAALSWSPTEAASNSLIHNALTRDLADIEQDLLNNGIGPRLRAVFWMQGEQDATTTLAAPDSATHQAYLQALYNCITGFSGYATVAMIVGRIRDQDPSFNATALAAVRAGQAAFVAANSGCTLIDTDSFPLQADNVHYTGAGMKSLGTAFYNAVTW